MNSRDETLDDRIASDEPPSNGGVVADSDVDDRDARPAVAEEAENYQRRLGTDLDAETQRTPNTDTE